MSEIAATLGDLSLHVKAGWVVWFAWGVVLFGWYRHARIAGPIAAAPTAAAQAVRFTNVPETPPASDTNDPPSAYNELNEHVDIPEHLRETGDAVR